MVTTRRSYESSNTYEKGNSNGNVALLERPVASNEVKEREDLSQAKERMQRNLDRLMNYDRYSAQQEEIASEALEIVDKSSELSDEDIRPTSTTMQFGDQIDQIRQDMNKASGVKEETYSLNKKGKVVAVLYSLAVAVILALIVLNTGVLSNLHPLKQEKQAQLAGLEQQYSAIVERVESISSSDYIIDVAENVLGMQK